MTNKPIVSVVIPAYNAERFIRRSLESVLRQTYENIEVLVSDDGSTDGTASVVKSYTDPRVRYSYQPNRGQGPARNVGIRQAKGEYIAFLDADDYYLPEKITREVEFLQQHLEYEIVYCNALHFYSDRPDRLLKKKRRTYPSGDIFPDLLRGSLINLNTLMVRRSILRENLMFSEGVEGRYCDEWDFYLRLSRAGNCFGWLDADVAVVEIRSDSHTQWEIQWKMKKTLLGAIEKLGLSAEEKGRLGYERLLRRHKVKLAVAYLVNMRKQDFFATLRDVYSVPTAYAVGGTVFLFPARWLSASLIAIWKLKQRRSFVTVQNPQ